jgi:PAP2 superfamily C-terminal
VIMRDVILLLVGCVAISIIGFVETHAMDADARVVFKFAGVVSAFDMPANPHGIVDTGFLITYPLYKFLEENRDWNDWLAGLNSFILLLPSIYAAYVTVWKGDYSCVFRILAVQLLRAMCGWFTYLPPDPSYLNSYYDFPDFVQCLFKDCHADNTSAGPEVLPFVSFFSGHVATMVVVGNDMALQSSTRQWAILMHVLNALQIVRLLATRGHYSIDMIIGWYVAVYVSAPAGRLGRYYSRGGASVERVMPKTPLEAFEYATGVADTRLERRMSALMTRPEVQAALAKMESEGDSDSEIDVRSNTTARILQETASKMMQEQAQMLQEELQHLQKQAKEAVFAMREQRLRERSSLRDVTSSGTISEGKKAR